MRFIASATSETILFLPAVMITCSGPKIIPAIRLPTISRFTSFPVSVIALLPLKNISANKAFLRRSIISSRGTSCAKVSMTLMSGSFLSVSRTPVAWSVIESPQEALFASSFGIISFIMILWASIMSSAR